MSLIKRMLRFDKCVYWAPLGKDQFQNYQFDNPIELDCRWADKLVIKRDQAGAETTYHAQVFVGVDLDLEGKLWHGKLDDLPVAQGDPSVPPEDARQILRFDGIPKLNYKEKLREANL